MLSNRNENLPVTEPETVELSASEIRELVDAVATAPFISLKDADLLKRKLYRLADQRHLETVTRNLHRADTRPGSRLLPQNIEIINEAINLHRQIQFCLYSWTPTKRLFPLKGGRLYTVSPYGIVWDHERFILVGWSDERQEIARYRIDRMKYIEILEEPVNRIKGFKMRDHLCEHKGIGAPISVCLLCRGDTMDDVIDYFGDSVATTLLSAKQANARLPVVVSRVSVSPGQDDSDAPEQRYAVHPKAATERRFMNTIPPERRWFVASVDIVNVPELFGWVFSHDGTIIISRPDDLAEQYQASLRRMLI